MVQNGEDKKWCMYNCMTKHEIGFHTLRSAVKNHQRFYDRVIVRNLKEMEEDKKIMAKINELY